MTDADRQKRQFASLNKPIRQADNRSKLSGGIILYFVAGIMAVLISIISGCQKTDDTPVDRLAIIPIAEGDSTLSVVLAQSVYRKISALAQPGQIVLSLNDLKNGLKYGDLRSEDTVIEAMLRFNLESALIISCRSDSILSTYWCTAENSQIKVFTDISNDITDILPEFFRSIGDLTSRKYIEYQYGQISNLQFVEHRGRGLWQQYNTQMDEAVSSLRLACNSSSYKVEIVQDLIESLLALSLDISLRGDSPEPLWIEIEKLLHENKDLLPDSIYEWLKGRLYLYRGRLNWAAESLKRAYDTGGEHPALLFDLARLHPSRWPEMKAKSAIALLERVLKLNPVDLSAAITLGNWYFGKNKSDAAEGVYRQFLHCSPDNVDILTAMGRIYVLRNEAVKIIEIYSRAIEIDPGSTEAYYNLGIAYFNSDRFDEAGRFFKHSLNLGGTPDNYLYLARLAELDCDTVEAINMYRLRLEHRLNGDDKFAMEARKRLRKMLNSGDYK